MDELQKLKKVLKKWEITFYKENGRKPQRVSICFKEYMYYYVGCKAQMQENW